MLVNSVFEYIKGYFYEQYLESIISFNHSMGSGLTTPINETTAKTLAGNQFDATFFSEHNDDGIIPPEVATQWATEHNITKTDYEINSLTKEENKTFNPTNPKCSSGHNMVLSDYAGGNYTGGYSCDYCSMNSTQGICGGGRTRWWCQECSSDICFDCYPCIPRCASNHVMCLSDHEYPSAPGMAWGCDLCRQNPKEPGHVGPMERWHCSECSSDFCLDCRPTPLRVGKPTSANDLAAIVRTSSEPPSGISAEHHRLVGTWMMAGNPVIVPLEAIAQRMIYVALKHKVMTQAQLQAMMIMYGGRERALPSMMFLIAHSCKDILIQWCQAFLSDFAIHPDKMQHFLPVFKFILADPNFVSFGLGSAPKGTTNPNFEQLSKPEYGGIQLTPDTTFIPTCHEICARELERIGVAGELMCAERGFIASLAGVGKDLQDVHGIRLDQVVGDNELWLELESHMNTQKSLDMLFDPGTEFCKLLELLNKVTEVMFAKIVTPVIESCGGSWKQAPPKNAMRMVGKLHLDHKDEVDPKSCANIDGVRGGACFHTAEELATCFQSLSDHESIRYLRVKNGFAAEKGNYGYRAVLVNMEFHAPSGGGDGDGGGGDGGGGGGATMTWGDVFTAPGMKELMVEYVNKRCENYEYEREFWDGVVTKITSHENFCSLPFKYIGEVQFLTDEYMEMRKESHLWYKILRQTYAYDLMNDLNKFYLPVKTRYKCGKTALKEA